MRVEVLEYGDDPERGFQEDAESFKVMTVWSEPVTESVDQIPATAEIHESPEKSTVEPKRLVTAVEFGIHKGGFFFIETPNLNPEWLNKVFDLLKDEGWMGYGFNEIRGNCRVEIEVLDEEDFTAVIDEKTGKVFHDRGLSKGDGKVESLEKFRDKERLKGVRAEVIRVEDDSVKVELENGHKICVDDRIGVSKEFEGEEAALTLVMMPGSVTTDSWEEIEDEPCIESLGGDKLACKVIGKVTAYDVEEEWPEAKSKFGYPLFELDVGLGKIVVAHENVPPVEEKQDYHEKGCKWKVSAKSLMLEDIEKLD